MRTLLALLSPIAFAALNVASAETAVNALKALPAGAVKNLARIQAHEGKPDPDRWHFLVYDPKAENGLREYVVTNGELVAARQVSQFADGLKPEDVIGGEALRIDSDAVARFAQEYAAANKKTVSFMNFELSKAGQEAAPAWRVTCIDPSGKEAGQVLITAGKGTILAHEGFPVEPKLSRVAAANPPPRNDEDEERASATPSTKPKSKARRPDRSEPEPVAERPRSGGGGERNERSEQRRASAPTLRGTASRDFQRAPAPQEPAPVRRENPVGRAFRSLLHIN